MTAAREHRTGRRLLIGGLVLVLLLAAGLLARWMWGGPTTGTAGWRGGEVPAAGTGDGTTLPTGAPATLAAGPPTRIRITKIGVDSPLESLHITDKGVLSTPVAFERVGWFAEGTSPGDPGPSVLAGHVDSRTGPAVFHRLHELAAGDTVSVARGDTWVSFRITAARWYPKSRFPTAEVYGPTPDPQLRLITCGGDFDRSRRSYVDNLVVFAVLDEAG